MNHIKNTVKAAFAVVYAGILSMSSKEDSKIIVYYHSILREEREGFRRQVEYMKQNFKIKKLFEMLSENDKHNKMLAITFDDAFENLLENAIPILAELDIPAAIFAPIGNTDALPKWDIALECSDAQERIMSKDQLVQLDINGYEIYSHTMTHPRLSELQKDELWSELFNSKKELERILDHEVNAISYPHGACNNQVFDLAQKAGYKYGFTIEPEILTSESSNMAIPRVSVSPNDSTTILKLKLMGAYGYSKYFKILKRLVGKITKKHKYDRII